MKQKVHRGRKPKSFLSGRQRKQKNSRAKLEEMADNVG
jgi:hypothetical protein